MTQNPQSPQQPMVLGDARDNQHVSLEDQQRHQQAVHQWQDQQAKGLKRSAGKARLKNVVVTALGSFLILGLLWVQAQAGRIDPPLILIPTALAVILVALAAVLPPWPDVAKALRVHKKNRRAERKRRE